jgi:hypothetical protein
MDWSDVAETVGKVAPIAGGALGGPAGSAIGDLLARALGVEATPESLKKATENPEAAAKLKAIEHEHQREIMSMTLQAETNRLAEVNATMRTEVKADDAYVRRWRPTFGYLVAVSWALQSIAIGWTIVATPEEAGTVAQSITALTPMWSVALAILGINVHKRSQDKQVSAGQQPVGFMGALSAIRKK